MEEERNENLAALLTLLREGYDALAKRDWNTASNRFARVTEGDPRCAEAWFGAALAEQECASVDEFRRARSLGSGDAPEETPAREPDEERVSAAVERFRIPGYLDEKEIRGLFGRETPTYLSVSAPRRRRLAEEREYWERDPLMSRAAALAGGDLAVTLRSVREQTVAALEKSLAASEERDRDRAAKAVRDYEERMDQAEQRAAERSRNAAARREEDYVAACEAQEAAKTPEEYLHAAEALEALGKFRDCRIRASGCREEAEQRGKRRRLRLWLDKLRTIVMGVVAVAAVAGVVALFLTRIVIPQNRYAAAETLRVAGDFNGAAKAYAALGDYRDSAAKALDSAHAAVYQEAEARLAAGDAEGASETFQSLGDYADSAARAEAIEQTLLQKRYQEAEALLAEGDYDRAAVGFRRLGDYADSARRAMEAQYRSAEALMQAGDYEGAQMRFELLEDYADSAQRASEARRLLEEAETEGQE